MKNIDVITEAPPISQYDSFVVFERHKSAFNFPIHIHNEFEINYIEGAKGAYRIVGDHITEIDDLELVLITGSNLEHSWQNHNNSGDIYEITIQFDPTLLTGGIVEKQQFVTILNMLEVARRGVSFSRNTILSARPLLLELVQNSDRFNSLLLFLKLLNMLSHDTEITPLSSSQFSAPNLKYDTGRINTIMDYLSKHYNDKICLSDVARIVNMSEVSLSRFIRQRAGKSFTECLNDVRIGAAARMLVSDTSVTVAEIAYNCGFNNISNFNRVFKKRQEMTPNEFRAQFCKRKIVI